MKWSTLKLTDETPQVYKDDPIHRIAAELSRADSKARPHSNFATEHHHSQRQSGGPLAKVLMVARWR